MVEESIPDFLRSAADAELVRLKASPPAPPEQRFMLFLEIGGGELVSDVLGTTLNRRMITVNSAGEGEMTNEAQSIT